MTTFSVHYAKTHLSRILTTLDVYDEVIITRYGIPIARLIPYAPQITKRQPGKLKKNSRRTTLSLTNFRMKNCLLGVNED